MKKHTYLTIILSLFILSAFGQNNEFCNKCTTCLNEVVEYNSEKLYTESCLIACLECAIQTPANLPQKIKEKLSIKSQEKTKKESEPDIDNNLSEEAKRLNIKWGSDGSTPCDIVGSCDGKEALLRSKTLFLIVDNWSRQKLNLLKLYGNISKKRKALQDIVPESFFIRHAEELRKKGFSKQTEVYRIHFTPKRRITAELLRNINK